MFWKKKSKKFLGIDVGTSSIKIIELEKQADKLKLENYGEVSETAIKRVIVPQGIGKSRSPLTSRQTAEIITSILREADIETKEVNFSIPDFLTFFTSFEMPAMEKEEVSEAIKYEVRPYIPLPLSEITLDWVISKGKSSKNPLKVLVAAIPNKIIVQYQEIASFADLELRSLEPEVFSLARASIKSFSSSLLFSKPKLLKLRKRIKKEPEKEEKKGEVVGLIDIGARTTTCSIVDRGSLKVSHSFNIAGEELVNRLAKSLNISYNKAKELIEKYGIDFSSRAAAKGISPNEVKRKDIAKEVGGFLNPSNVQEKAVESYKNNINEVLSPLVDVLLEDIKRVFRDFYKEEGREVEKVILAGGVALSPGLKEYFYNKLKKETIISNPFENISYPSVLSGILEKKSPSYAVGVGLAIKGLE